MRHRRNDHEDGTPVSPFCTTCTKIGLSIPETMYHIFVECIGATRSTHLRLKLNNVYRKYHPVTTPSDDYTTVESFYGLLDDESETIRQPGWKRVSTDKLERKTIRDTGPAFYTNPYSAKPRRAD